MKRSVTERFKEIIDAKSSTLTSFSEAIGVKQSTLSSQFAGKNGIQVSVITATLKRFPDISAEWLFRGKGEMLLSNNLPPIIGDESENDMDTHALLARKLIQVDELTKELEFLKDKIKKQEGCIEWQKGYIAELVIENHEHKKTSQNSEFKYFFTHKLPDSSVHISIEDEELIPNIQQEIAEINL